MNGFDYLAGAYLAWSLVKGYRRGAAPELYALLSLLLLLALVLGFGLFSSIRSSLGWVLERQPGLSPAAAVVLVSLLSLLIFFWVRRRLRQLRDPAPVRRRGTGALLGGLRALLLILTLVGVAPYLPTQGLRNAVGPDSWSGRLGLPLAEAARSLAQAAHDR